jgi:ribosomal protein S18 acetylase RimI-like enzyme
MEHRMEVILRNVQPHEETLIFSFLVLAARMPEGGEPMQKALSDPFLKKYWVNWGGPGDIGIVAEDSSTGVAVACAWVRLFTKEQAGACFVGEHVPELAMGVVPEYRGSGIGTKALRRLLEEIKLQFRGICLSVRSDNPAVRLYERLSFQRVAESEMTNRVGTKSYNMYLEF